MGEPYWASEDGDVVLHLGDCLDVLRTLEADSIDAIVTDPPAGIAFMDREWDDFRRARNPADAGRDSVFGRTSARGPEYGRRDRGQFVDMLTARLAEAYRVLKPGGHALVWSIPRTSHWTAWAVEDAGFDVRDCILHLFGSGFPKSLDVSKAIDKAAGAEREIVGRRTDGRYASGFSEQAKQAQGAIAHDFSAGWVGDPAEITAPATEDAVRWEGWGTALKPGQEIWWLARKPLKGTVAASVLEFGTGALNIDGCKVATTESLNGGTYSGTLRTSAVSAWNAAEDGSLGNGIGEFHQPAGRWPANVVFTHSASCDGRCAPDCPAGELDRQSGVQRDGVAVNRNRGAVKPHTVFGTFGGAGTADAGYGGQGGASRFYPVFRYQAKAPASERPRLEDGTAHETVKSLGLMTWMVKLITPPGGTVLDMFAGSGPVAEVCIIEGFRCVLIEQGPKSCELIKTRLRKPIQPTMFRPEDSAPATPVRPAAASRPKPAPVVHPSLFDLEAS